MNQPPLITLPEHARRVVSQLEDHGFEAYVVGGCVRDSLLGDEPKDWDVCTNATPEQVLRVFRRRPVIKTGLKHGTVTVLEQRRPVEVTTYRIDGDYVDNRHPESVSFVGNITEDLARRDFTINAMAYSPKRGLVDAFGGQEDLARGLIRCVGEPDARFQEDGLRILRALRFAGRYDFAIEAETAYAIRRNRLLLENISAERLFSELKGILCGRGASAMLRGFPEVFAVFMPEIAPCIGFEQHNPYHLYDVWTHTALAVQAIAPEPVLRLAMLMHDLGKPACFTQDARGVGHFHGHPQKSAEAAAAILGRLKSDNATRSAVVTLVEHHDDALPTTRAGMCRLIGKLGEQRVRQLFEVKKADNAAQSPYAQERNREPLLEARCLFEEVLEQHGAFRIGDLALNGRDLISIGLRPGPAIGRILAALLAEVQDGALANTQEALAARARALIAEGEATSRSQDSAQDTGDSAQGDTQGC